MGNYDPKNDKSSENSRMERTSDINYVKGAYHCVIDNEIAHLIHKKKSELMYIFSYIIINLIIAYKRIYISSRNPN